VNQIKFTIEAVDSTS